MEKYFALGKICLWIPWTLVLFISLVLNSFFINPLYSYKFANVLMWHVFFFREFVGNIATSTSDISEGGEASGSVQRLKGSEVTFFFLDIYYLYIFSYKKKQLKTNAFPQNFLFLLLLRVVFNFSNRKLLFFTIPKSVF